MPEQLSDAVRQLLRQLGGQDLRQAAALLDASADKLMRKAGPSNGGTGDDTRQAWLDAEYRASTYRLSAELLRLLALAG